MKKTGILFVLFFLLSVSVHAMAQREKVNLKLENVSLKDFFQEIQRQTGLYFVYNDEICQNFGQVSVNVKNETIARVLDDVFGKTSYFYQFEGDIIIVKQREQQNQQLENITVKGKVTDTKGVPLPGVGILIEGTTLGTATDRDGNYTITCPVVEGLTLLYSFVGMKTVQIEVKGRTQINVVLEEDVTEMDEVVVTGIFQKAKESYTGAVSVITEKELKSFGSRNVLTTLRNIDPSFNIIESNEWGSNPNRLPEIQIRGAANMPDIDQLQDESNADLNTPLIIMDGFEITLERMMDLNDNEIETITLLKDASATAIYGSRGANGVIVISTKEPEPGKLRLTYTGSLNIEVPDLTDYHVLNAREKLDLEYQSGYYNYSRAEKDFLLKQKYNEILAQVERAWILIGFPSRSAPA